MQEIGIIGQGFVGSAVREGMQNYFKVFAFDKDPNVVAVLASPMSSDAYDGLYKRAKDSSVEDVVKNYKKFFKPSEKTPKDMIKKGYPEMKKVYYPKL